MKWILRTILEYILLLWIVYGDVLYAIGNLDWKYEAGPGAWGLHYTYAHVSYRIHACKAIGAHAVMHKLAKRGWQLRVLLRGTGALSEYS